MFDDGFEQPVGPDVSRCVRRNLKSVRSVKSGGAAAQRKIDAAVPIDLVMPGTKTWLGKIGNFIMFIAALALRYIRGKEITTAAITVAEKLKAIL